MLNYLDVEQEFLQILLLRGLAPLAGERTLQALYYILRGRKANQTHQDLHLFNLYPYYRLFPRLSKERWEEILAELERAGYIRSQPLSRDERKRSFQLTDKGKISMQSGSEKYSLNKWFAPLQDAAIVDTTANFWLRLHLMVQTVSHLLHDNRHFFPIVQHKQTQLLVKTQLSSPDKTGEWKNGLYPELISLLEAYPDGLQKLVFKQFSGETQTGLTLDQLAYQTAMPPSFLQVQLKYIVADMCRRIQQQGEVAYPLLVRLVDKPLEDGRLSQSAAETYRFLKRNYRVEEIARARKLTKNTVEDHLVEISMNCPEWDISFFVTPEEQHQIISASQRLATRRLRLLKDELGDKYTYLQIRLALARMKGAASDE